MIHVGLNDVDYALFHDFTHSVRRDQAFARGDRRVHAPRDARHGLDVLRWTWLLHPQQPQRFQFLDDDRRHARTGLGVEVDRDINVRTQTFAQHLDVAYRFGDLLVGLDPFVV